MTDWCTWMVVAERFRNSTGSNGRLWTSCTLICTKATSRRYWDTTEPAKQRPCLCLLVSLVLLFSTSDTLLAWSSGRHVGLEQRTKLIDAGPG